MTTAAPIKPATGSWWSARLGWSIGASVFVVFAVVSVANMQTGMHGDPRTTNPDPAPAPYPAFLGVDNWPVVMNTVAVLLTMVFFGAAASAVRGNGHLVDRRSHAARSAQRAARRRIGKAHARRIPLSRSQGVRPVWRP